MLTIRGIYDGKAFKILPCEPVPAVQREVPVAIIFLEDVAIEHKGRQQLLEVAKRMRSARDAMGPLGVSVKALVEEGRER